MAIPVRRRHRTTWPGPAAAVLLLVCGVGLGHAQSDPVVLDTVRVTVESRAAPSSGTRSVEVLTRADIAALPVRSVAEVLRWAVGTDLDERSPAQADVSIRGASFEQVVVLVNGVRVSDPQTGHFDLDLAVPLEQVERIEILRGPASSLYGADAVGGVIHVVTRGARETGVAARFEAGTFGTRHAATRVTGTSGRVAIAVGADWTISDGHRTGTDHEIRAASVNARAAIGRAVVHLDGGWAERAFGADGFYAPFPSWEQTGTRTGALHVTVPVGRLILLHRTWARSHDDEFVLRRGDPTFYRNVHTSTQTGTEIVARRALGSAGAVVAGAEWVRESLASTRLGDRREDRLAAFTEFALGIGRSRFHLGVRADHYARFGLFAAPSVSAAVLLSGRVRLRGAASRSFRAPTWTERYYQDPANRGRPDLEPEKAWAAELGLDLFTSQRTKLQITAFARRASDLIDWTRAEPGTVWETRNVERATFAGLEAAVSGPIIGPVRGRLGASLLNVETTEPPGLESKQILRPLTRQLTVTLESGTGPHGTVMLGVLHARRDFEDAFTRVDAQYRIPAGGAEIRLQLRNVFDAAYDDVTRRPAAGRAISIGYRVELGSADERSASRSSRP